MPGWWGGWGGGGGGLGLGFSRRESVPQGDLPGLGGDVRKAALEFDGFGDGFDALGRDVDATGRPMVGGERAEETEAGHGPGVELPVEGLEEEGVGVLGGPGPACLGSKVTAF